MRARPDGALNRRDFLKRTTRASRVLELSCERLYMRYVDARGAGRLPEFLHTLEVEIAAADEVRVTGREWLSHDDFRQDLDPVLRACE
jgi:hypothetical protein